MSLWSALKKKPMTTVKAAHNDQGVLFGSENWITAVAALQYTDLVASGNHFCDKQFVAFTLKNIPGS